MGRLLHRIRAKIVAMSAATVPQRLVLVGSVVVDVNLRVPRLPDRGGDVIASALSIAAGGGMFVLRAATRGGLPAMYAGRHGIGAFGDVVRSALHEAGVELAYAAEPAGDTGPCIVLVEPDGERTMITSTGVEAELSLDRLEQLVIHADDAIYVSGYDLAYDVTGPAVTRWLPRVPASALLVLDSGPLVAEIPAEVLNPVLRRTDVLTLNAREGVLLTDSVDPGAVGTALLARIAHGGVVILRDGPRGATLLESGAAPQAVPVTAISATDTTGAGDTHAGALVAARGRGLDWPAAVQAANDAVATFLVRPEH
jgi:sugar/nucleoside kinase (ribokinase family)